MLPIVRGRRTSSYAWAVTITGRSQPLPQTRGNAPGDVHTPFTAPALADASMEAAMQTQADTTPAAPAELDDPKLYTNRELSWLDFNERVLELAEDDRIKLLERVKFAAIFSSNLDEFFMIRVAGLQDQIEAGIEARGPDGLDATATAARVRERTVELCARQSSVWSEELAPALAAEGIRVVGCADVPEEHRSELQERFRRQIYPVLTPLAVGPGRPFPYISNLSLSLAVLLRDPIANSTTFARV